MQRIMVGYIIAWFSFLPWIHRHCRVMERDPDALQPEARLYWLLWGRSLLSLLFPCQTLIVLVAPLLSIGLFGFAWTSLGPKHHVHWIAPMIFSSCIAIANVSFSSGPLNLSNAETVCHLHGHDRLHDCLLRTILRLSNRRQCPSTRLPRRHRSHVFRSK
jgi:hypothetical protein